MQFKGKVLSDMKLKELQDASWELAGVEINYIKSLEHPKFEKIKPKPEMNPSFKALQNAIKQEIEKRTN